MNHTTFPYGRILLFALAAAVVILVLVIDTLRTRKKNAMPVETARAMAYCKHPEIELTTVRTNVGLRNDTTHFITFHTESGDILKLYMSDKYFYDIPEGSWGMLTWQGNRLWKFEKEESA